MSYKKTLNLPQTDFEMRGNLSKKEPKIIEFWNQINLYSKLQEKNKENKSFFLHDGPPYANGSIHVGHALNKILKDFVNKSKAMNGYHINFIPGWDTHGLPIEQKVTESGVDRKAISPLEFRKHCEKYAFEQIEIQKAQMLRLGLIGRFDKPYITLENKYEAKQLEVFFAMYEKGLIHKGLKPIYWSPSSESALAEAEIEYHDKRSPSIFVSFEVSKGNKVVNPGEKILIWTTTPWTIPSNVGVAIGAKINYVKVKASNDQVYIIAQDTIENIQQETELKFEVIQEFRGADLIDIEYNHPFIKRIGKVVLGHHVTTESGTGLVHMAGSHGEDDFIICKDNNLEILNYIDDKGYFIDSSPIAAGEFWLDANKTIGEALAAANALVKLRFITHSYPHDWRTKKPVMFKATPQWFGSVAKIKTKLMEAIKEVKWIPDWGMNRLGKMLEDRADWCISRQRVWGVPIPIFYGEDNQPILDPKLNKHIINLFKEHGSDIWFSSNVSQLLPLDYSHPSSPNGKFRKETDIMDVWFDSGSSYHAVKENNDIKADIDLYLEGSDQYRGWFNSSLITAVAKTSQAPYKAVLTHGFVLDGKGEKMSKSKGNVIDPIKINDQKGADILRLWVASSKYQSDIRISPEIIDQISEYYRGIRFKIRFAMSNLYDFELKDQDTYDFSPYDKYALMLIQKFNQNCVKWYQNYQFGEIFNATNNLLNNLSAHYFDYTKDITYIYRPDAPERRSIQRVMHYFVDVITRVLAPILSFTTEEAYKHFNKPNKKESIFLEDMQVDPIVKHDQKHVDLIEKLIEVKNDIYQEIEILRKEGVIAKSGECDVVIKLINDYQEVTNLDNIKQYLMLASIEFSDSELKGEAKNTGQIKVSKTSAKACERCRSFKHEMIKDICHDCNEILG